MCRPNTLSCSALMTRWWKRLQDDSLCFFVPRSRNVALRLLTHQSNFMGSWTLIPPTGPSAGEECVCVCVYVCLSSLLGKNEECCRGTESSVCVFGSDVLNGQYGSANSLNSCCPQNHQHNYSSHINKLFYNPLHCRLHIPPSFLISCCLQKKKILNV